GIALVGRHGSRVDDRRPLAEVRKRRLRQVEHREDVGAEGTLELLGRNLLDRLLRVLLARVVDEDVEAAESADRPLDERAAMRLLSDVAGDEETGAAGILLDEPLRFLGILMLVEIGDDDLRAFAREGDRDGAPDAAVAAGHERDLALEL